MLLDNVRVVLVNTRFPENIGMAVRACANMGCPELVLVTPERWIPEKAAPLATPKGLPLLEKVKVAGSLAEATADCHCIIGTTARTGGWRKALLSPQDAGMTVSNALSRSEKVALVFGSEDRGLENSHIELCRHIATIPTSGEASSLNLAQSVLLFLWECACARREALGTAPHPTVREIQDRQEETSVGITGADSERLMGALKEALSRLDALHGNNPDYFLMPWRRLFDRARLRRHEYDALMGLCRQIRAKVPADDKTSSR